MMRLTRQLVLVVVIMIMVMKILMSSMFEVVNTQINPIQILLLKIISVKDLLRIYNLIQIFELGG